MSERPFEELITTREECLCYWKAQLSALEREADRLEKAAQELVLGKVTSPYAMLNVEGEQHKTVNELLSRIREKIARLSLLICDHGGAE